MGFRYHLPIAGLLVGALLATGWSTPLDRALPAVALRSEQMVHLGRESFLENKGQVGNVDIRYYLPGDGLSIGFAKSAVLFSLTGPADADASNLREDGAHVERRGPHEGALIRLAFEGANEVEPRGLGEAPHRSHFLVGRDPAGWATQVRSYHQLVFESLYDGVDLIFSAEEVPKYEFHVRPGTDPAMITWTYEGVEEIFLDATGGLQIRTSVGAFTDSPPVSFQGDTTVTCVFEPRGARSFGFACKDLDPSRALVIDPLIYSTFLGGVGQSALSVAVDGTGSAYVAGATWSSVFPTTPGAFDVSFEGPSDAFIMKLNPFGTALEYATYLGGSYYDYIFGITVDGTGAAYVVGATESTDFPTTVGAYDRTLEVNDSMSTHDAFVARVGPSGDTLTWATYLGGGHDEIGYSIAHGEASGLTYVTGFTGSVDFPATSGAYDTDLAGGLYDAFVSVVNDTGNLTWSTYLGGTFTEEGRSIALDRTGTVFVAGYTYSADFPLTPGAVDTTSSSDEAFVAQLDATGSTLLYATLLGGSAGDAANSLALDDTGKVYVAGSTVSDDFPATPGAYDGSYNGNEDLFVAALEPGAGRLVFATYLGGTLGEYFGALDVDGAGSVYVVARTQSLDFPTTRRAYDRTYGGSLSDAFVTRLDPTGSSLVNSTFLGGSGPEHAEAVVLDDSGDAYVIGWSSSADFPVTPGAFDTDYGGQDSFVTKLRLPPEPPPLLPPTNLTATVVGPDIILNWDPSPDPNMMLCNCSHYEIYGGSVPYGLDFSAAIGRSPTWRETTWEHLGAASPSGEYYYTVMAVNATSNSPNTNTAGRLTVSLRKGLNAVSLPLDPFSPLTTGDLRNAMGATAVEWMNAGSWDSSDAPAVQGEAFLVTMPAASLFTYTGLPAAHILYSGGPGFDPKDARLSATAAGANGDVALSWPSAPGASEYRVYRAAARTGFHQNQRILLGTVSAGSRLFTATGEITGPGSRYYMVVPVVAGAEGGSTYSIGIETLGLAGTEAFGVPVRLDVWPAVTDLTDGIEVSLGTLWLTASGEWVPHFREMPAGVYDTTIEWALGYQIQVRGVTRVSFVGS